MQLLHKKTESFVWESTMTKRLLHMLIVQLFFCSALSGMTAIKNIVWEVAAEYERIDTFLREKKSRFPLLPKDVRNILRQILIYGNIMSDENWTTFFSNLEVNSET